MKPEQIIVIQTSVVGGMEARHIFDEHGIERDVNYVYFNAFNKLVIECVLPNTPLLVFTSHVDHTLDSRDVARDIKAINPTALVFALTTSPAPHPLKDLDGVCSKNIRGREMAVTLAKQFLTGKGRDEILRTFRQA